MGKVMLKNSQMTQKAAKMERKRNILKCRKNK